MLDGWGNHPVVAQTLLEASEALGEDVGKLIREGPKEALALTTNSVAALSPPNDNGRMTTFARKASGYVFLKMFAMMGHSHI